MIAFGSKARLLDGERRYIVIKDGKICYETGEEIQFGERLSVITPDGQWLILHFTEFIAGTQMVQNEKGETQQIPQMARGLLCKGQPVNPEMLRDCKIYYVIDGEGAIVEVKDDGEEIPN